MPPHRFLYPQQADATCPACNHAFQARCLVGCGCQRATRPGRADPAAGQLRRMACPKCGAGVGEAECAAAALFAAGRDAESPTLLFSRRKDVAQAAGTRPGMVGSLQSGLGGVAG